MLNTEEIIKWVLMNFGLAMLLLAIPIFIIHMLVNLFRHRQSNAEIIYIWVSFLAVGFTSLYAFVMHVFFPVTSAAAIGWHNSPFQFEVGMANLGFGLVALLAAWGSYGFRLANVIGLTCWLWGDAIGHIYQMILANNYSVGNAGSWFWMDLVLPLILIICIIKMRKSEVKPTAQYEGPI